MTIVHGMMRDEESEGRRCPMCSAYLDDGYYTHQCSGSTTPGSLILSSLEAEDETELGRTWAANTEEAP